MTARPLHARDAQAGTLASWARAWAAALDGGPALLPLPAGPESVRERLLAALRPGDPTAPLESPEAVLVVPTSGSTGEPKGAVLTASAVRASAQATQRRLAGPGHWVLALPLTHVAGQMVLARAVLAGGVPEEVAPGPERSGFSTQSFAASTRLAAREADRTGRPLYVSVVPTQLARLLDDEVDLRPYAAVLVGAAAAPPGLLDRAREAGATVVTTYGMTETCGGCVYDGRALDGVTVDLADDGRVVLGGATLFAGYRLRPDLTAAATDAQGRFVTSDLGAVDGDGVLHILGRADDVIVSGGENVAPARVEAVLGELADVGACTVVGVPDAEWGERVVALVVPVGDADPQRLVPEAVRAATAAALPAAWLPRSVVLVEAIPMLATGKVDRAAARALARRAERP
jgi:O-succinylbenzoic acid--CoA ligase